MHEPRIGWRQTSVVVERGGARPFSRPSRSCAEAVFVNRRRRGACAAAALDAVNARHRPARAQIEIDEPSYWHGRCPPCRSGLRFRCAHRCCGCGSHQIQLPAGNRAAPSEHPGARRLKENEAMRRQRRANTTATHPEQAHVAVGCGHRRPALRRRRRASRCRHEPGAPSSSEADVLGANKRIAEANRAHFAAARRDGLNLVPAPARARPRCCARPSNTQAPPRPGGGDRGRPADPATMPTASAPPAPRRSRSTPARAATWMRPMVAEAFATCICTRIRTNTMSMAAITTTPRPRHATAAVHRERRQPVCPAMWGSRQTANRSSSVTEARTSRSEIPLTCSPPPRLDGAEQDRLLPYLISTPKCIAYARRVNPIEVLLVSAKTGAGLDAWVEWLMHPPLA